jgi:hypothetical protein
MSENTADDRSWLIDLILSFFHSAEWKAPVLSYIEEKCIVFDDEEENKLEYTIIHKEFKKLTEGLIEAMLWELGATPEMFGEAFDKAKDTPGYDKITKIIESIDSYQIFAKMMRKKNASLNEAAFRLLNQHEQDRYRKSMDETNPNKIEETKITDVPTTSLTKINSNVTKQGDDVTKGNPDTKNDQDLKIEQEQMEIIRSISIREEEERRRINEEEERMLAEVIALSTQEHEEELKRKALGYEEKERLLKEKEEKLKLEEERIKRENELFEQKKLQYLKEEQTKKSIELAPLHTKTHFDPLPVASVAPVITEKPKKKKKKNIISEKSREPLPDEATSELVQKTATKMTYDLPPVSNDKKSGSMMAADYDILKAASSDLFGKKKDKTYDPYADEPNFDSWNKKSDEEGKSMRELMKEKMDKMHTTTKQEPELKESMEERKARLKAQRDLLVKQKQDQMQKELLESREGKTDNKYSNNLFKELMSLDKNVTAQEAKKKKIAHPKSDSPDLKPNEDDESEVIEPKKPKKDMRSLFDDSDDDEEKKKAEDVARKERYRQVMKQVQQDNM